MRVCSKASLRLLVSLLILGVAGPAWAQVTINQSKALAGNVTPGDAAGFPVTLSQPGSYVLTGNLTVPNANTNAIDITVDNVTVDFNGFVIQGPTVCSGTPPSAPVSCTPTGTGKGVNAPFPRTGIVVKNGQVRGMGNIGLTLGSSSRVEGVTARSNGNHGIVASTGSTVTGTTASFNRNVGILTVSSNTASSNGSNGITASSSTVSGNTASFNKGGGIVAFGGTVTGNTATGNGTNGIFASDGSTVLDNRAYSNVSFGLSLSFDSGYGNNVVNNNNGGNANPQVLNGIQIGTNVCGGNTLCP